MVKRLCSSPIVVSDLKQVINTSPAIPGFAQCNPTQPNEVAGLYSFDALHYYVAQGTRSLAATAPGSRLNSLALTNLHGRLVVDGGGTHAFLDLPSHCQESLLDIRSVLGGGLQEWDP